jgi:hypothetical protein
MMMDGYLKLLRNLKTVVTYEKKYASIVQRYGNVENLKYTAYVSKIVSPILYILIRELGGTLNSSWKISQKCEHNLWYKSLMSLSFPVSFILSLVWLWKITSSI